MKFAWRFVLATSLVACSSTTSHEDGAAPAELAPAMQSGGVPGGASTEVSRGAESAPICSPGELRNCGSCGEQRCRRVAKGELSGTEWGECVSLRPGRREICNGLDDDCNGLVDDGITCVDAGPPPPPPVVDAGPVEPPPSPCSERCTGASIVLDRTAAYGLWVKVVLCSPTRYDLFLGPTQAGPFSKITDTNHLGQDHCELVNPAFTLPNEAAITSGTTNANPFASGMTPTRTPAAVKAAVCFSSIPQRSSVRATRPRGSPRSQLR